MPNSTPISIEVVNELKRIISGIKVCENYGEPLLKYIGKQETYINWEGETDVDNYWEMESDRKLIKELIAWKEGVEYLNKVSNYKDKK
jgi:hypothetical protein